MPNDTTPLVGLTDEQIRIVREAATPLMPLDRSAFLNAVMARLRLEHEIGNGLVSRIARDVLREGSYRRNISA